MGYFPMCLDITGKAVLLIGSGPQTEEKAEKLAPFAPRIIRAARLEACMLKERPVFVIAGDLPREEAERTAAICSAHGIALNVVDVPRLCTFTFPSMIVNGDLTVSVSTGGQSPGAAAAIRRRLEPDIPAAAGDILNWLADVRADVRARYEPAQSRAILGALIAQSLDAGRPLTGAECDALIDRIIS